MANCKCMEQVNAALAPHNTRLAKSMTLDLNAKVGSERSVKVLPIITTEKIDSKKRGKTKTVVPSFCPFCGKGYDA